MRFFWSAHNYNNVRNFNFIELWKQEIFIVRDRIAGNEIEEFNSLEEAQKCIELFEIQDKKEGIYVPDFYEVYDAEKED